MDVDTVEPGVDFVHAIEKAVDECGVLVALIGKRWVGSEPEVCRVEGGQRSTRCGLGDGNVSRSLIRTIL